MQIYYSRYRLNPGKPEYVKSVFIFTCQQIFFNKILLVFKLNTTLKAVDTIGNYTK